VKKRECPALNGAEWSRTSTSSETHLALAGGRQAIRGFLPVGSDSTGLKRILASSVIGRAVSWPQDQVRQDKSLQGETRFVFTSYHWEIYDGCAGNIPNDHIQSSSISINIFYLQFLPKVLQHRLEPRTIHSIAGIASACRAHLHPISFHQQSHAASHVTNHIDLLHTAP
jgi:hypothetical protein